MATCIAIVNQKTEKSCGAEALGPCNMCKFHMLDLLMKAEKEGSKVSKKAPAKSNETKKDKVKKPLTNPYLLFSADMRADVKHCNPEMKTSEITAELGSMWNQLKEEDPEEHQRYVKMAARAKARYEAEQKGETYVSEAEDDSDDEE